MNSLIFLLAYTLGIIISMALTIRLTKPNSSARSNGLALSFGWPMYLLCLLVLYINKVDDSEDIFYYPSDKKDKTIKKYKNKKG